MTSAKSLINDYQQIEDNKMNTKKLPLYKLAIYAHHEISIYDLKNISVNIELKHNDDIRAFTLIVHGKLNGEDTCKRYDCALELGTMEQHTENIKQIINAIATDDFSHVNDIMTNINELQRKQ